MEVRRVHHFLAELSLADLTLGLFGAAIEKAYSGHSTLIDGVLGPLRDAGDTTLLILGNSHAGALGRESLRSDDRVFNASVGGQDIFRSYLLVRNYLPRLPRLREVILA